MTPRWAIMLVVLLAQSAGLFIGATVSNIKNCLAIASVTMLTLMLVGNKIIVLTIYTTFNIWQIFVVQLTTFHIVFKAPQNALQDEH